MDTLIFQLKPAYFVVGFLFLCCSTKGNEGSKNIEGSHKQDSVVTTQGPKIIYTVSANHFFSSNISKDKFLIELYGTDTLKASITFKIMNSVGDLIYSTEFESRALLDYGLPENPSKREKAEYILLRMNNFFKEENFVTPAIRSDEIYDKDYYGIIGESMWNKVKSNSHSIGFYYSLWEGSQSWITFYEKHKQVLKYKTCC
ncbi:MAG: hypothetical protein E6Q96_09665 [Cyclobacteriaceae bacterium]|nr:MAG: hypothetical protein E6Q96_09665 [Cyclobacteriaceae bacterium]